MTLLKLPLFGSLLIAGCIATQPTQRPKMSALEHEAEARRAEQLAAVHERRRDPDMYSVQRCGVVGSPSVGPAGGQQPGSSGNAAPSINSLDPCNSTFSRERDHEREAERQRWIAAQHRAEAARIRSREAQACNALPNEERTARPIETKGDVLAVRELPDYSRTGKGSSQRGGATVLVRGQPGMTADRLERVLRCDAARAEVEGDAAHTPWAVPGARAAVVETDDGLLVEVTADDRATAEEIARRAELLSGSKRDHVPEH